MKKRKNNIKQHFIPRLHMSRFTNSKNMMNVYDWKRKLHYKVKPGKENYKNYYHDINPKFIKLVLNIDEGYDELVDDTIRKLHEEVLGKVFNEIVNKLKNGINNERINLNDENINRIIQFIILQNLRTPWYRETINYMATSFLLYFNIELEKENIDESEVTTAIHNIILYMIVKIFNEDKPDWPEKFELFFGFFLEEQMNLYGDLLNSSKLFLINDTTMPFVTTDNPVNIQLLDDGHEFGMLLTPLNKSYKTIHVINKSPFKTIFLPISSEIGIYFLNRKYDKSFEFHSNMIGLIKEEKIDMVHNINLSMASKSKGKIYCKDNNFTELKKMIKNKSPVKIVLDFNYT